MKRKLRFLFCLCVVAALSGCAMCDNCWDDAYTGLIPQSILDARRHDVPARVDRWRRALATRWDFPASCDQTAPARP